MAPAPAVSRTLRLSLSAEQFEDAHPDGCTCRECAGADEDAYESILAANPDLVRLSFRDDDAGHAACERLARLFRAEIGRDADDPPPPPRMLEVPPPGSPEKVLLMIWRARRGFLPHLPGEADDSLARIVRCRANGSVETLRVVDERAYRKAG